MRILAILFAFSSTWVALAQSAPIETLWTKTNVPGEMIRLTNGTFRSGGQTHGITLELFDENGARLDSATFGVTVPATDGAFRSYAKAGVPFGGANFDPFVEKVDPRGVPLWTNSVGVNAVGPAGVIPLVDGGCIAVANRHFRHFSADGNLLYVSPTLDFSPGDVIVKDDGYLVGGVWTEEMRAEDYALADLDKAGNVRWSRRYGGSGLEFFARVRLFPDGSGILLGGTSLSPVSKDKTTPLEGASDWWFIKVTLAGEKIWDASVGGASDQVGGDFAFVGNAIVALIDQEVFGLNWSGVEKARTPFTVPMGERRDSGEIEPINSTDFLARLGNGLARMRLPAAPIVTQHPADEAVLSGGAAIFRASADSLFETATYQWLFNGQPIANETNATLTISGVTAQNAGAYSVRVRNSAGEIISRPAQLSITDAELKLRMHPSLEIRGLLNRRYAIERAPVGSANITWERADTITLTNNPQIWVDTSLELPDRRLYRARLDE
jgi:hypothetical protein